MRGDAGDPHKAESEGGDLSLNELSWDRSSTVLISVWEEEKRGGTGGANTSE